MRVPLLFRWLALAALIDWLIGRTLTRSAIFMPKPPLVLALYQGLGTVAAVASTLTGLLALGGLAWVAWDEWRTRRAAGLPLMLAALAAMSVVALFSAPSGWFAASAQALIVAAVAALAWRTWAARTGPAEALLMLTPALALLAASLYQLAPAVYQALRWPGPPPFTGAVFGAGELLAVLSPAALWWLAARGHRAGWGVWLAAGLPALAYTALQMANPSMAGILSIWSTGLTLYLPWPVYAISLWLAGVTVWVALRADDPAGWALLMLAAGGYAPQLSTQVILGLIAVWLLARRGAASGDQPAAAADRLASRPATTSMGTI